MATFQLPKFGFVGLVYDYETALDYSAGQLLSSFDPSWPAARIVWNGDGLLAAASAPPADVRLAAGEHRITIPRCEQVQAIVYGYFFGDNRPELTAVQSLPEAISSQLLEDYIGRGEKALNALNGAWAAVIWDRQQSKLGFARDVIGVETFYVVRRPGVVAFATDLRLLHHLELVGLLDEQAVAEFLHYLYVPAPRTIYQNVLAVLPAHILWLGETLQQSRYAPPRYVRGKKLANLARVEEAMAEYLPRFEEVLLQAVADCLPATGRIGLLQSWGKDSVSLAIALSKITPERTVTMTIGGQGMRIDESQHAAKVSQHLGLEHIAFETRHANLLQGVSYLISQQDQPFGDPASLPLALGVQHFPDDVEVILDGTGNDYYFGIVKQRISYNLRMALRKVIPDALWPRFASLLFLAPQKVRWALRSWHNPLEESFVSWFGWSKAELERLWGREIYFDDTLLWQKMRQNFEKGLIVAQTEAICGIWEPHAVSRKSWHLGRSTGRGVRFPFTDNRLARFVHEIPEELQFQGETNKVLLRAFMARHLPDELLEKRKGYFSFDLTSVLEQDKQAWVKSLQEADLLSIVPNWSAAVVEEMLQNYRHEPPHFAHRLYALCLIASWYGLWQERLPENISVLS